MDTVAIGALGDLIATAIAAAAGKSWKDIRSSAEAKTVRGLVYQSLDEAFSDAYRGPVPANDDWVTAVARIWERAFTGEVSQALIRCLASMDDEGQREFSALAGQALHDSGCDAADLNRTFWAEQFLCMLPRLLFERLKMTARDADSPVRNLVGHLLDQRAEARAASVQVMAATPRQFREDLIALLRRLSEDARTGRLPPYLPCGADVSMLTRTVRVRRGLRTSLRQEVPAEETAGSAYRLPVERAEDSEPARPWPEVAAENRRLVVLADPGLGKSWLIRTETHRLCQQALAAVERGDDVDALIPVPVRCDQLVAGGGQTLAQAAAEYLVAQQLVPPRSRSGLQARVDAGQTVLLLDALDELTTDEQYGRLKEMLRSWQAQDHKGPRCILTSRIAGYRGSPLPDACEVELQAFTSQDVTAATTAWRLPPPVRARVLARAKDPAVAGMIRVPLLLALLCSLAAELPDGQQLPATRGAV